MPLKNFENIGVLQGYEYLKGFITSINYENDTCSVEIKTGEEEDGTIKKKTLTDVPIFYHCDPNAEESVSTGALRRGAFGFKLYSKVIVLKRRDFAAATAVEKEAMGEDQNQAAPEKVYVIGHEDGPRKCGMLVVVTTKSGHDVVVWDMVSDNVFMGWDQTKYIDDVLSELTTMGFNPVLAEKSGTVDDAWVIEYPNHFQYDGIYNLPIFVWNINEPSGTLTGVYTVPYPSIYIHTLSYMWTWSLDFIELDGETDKKSSYMVLVDGESTEAVKDEFETLTGLEWRRQNSLTPNRRFLYFHSMFNFEMGGWNPGDESYITYLQNLNQMAVKVYDEWADNVYQYTGLEDPIYDISGTGAWMSLGIAKNNSGVLTYEYVGLCFDINEDEESCSSDDHRRVLFRIFTKQERMLSKRCRGVLDSVNTLRSTALTPTRYLIDAAERHVADMARNSFLSHTGTDGSTPETRIIAAGQALYIDGVFYNYSGGENVLKTKGDLTPQEVVDAWMTSLGHAANIMNEDWTGTGIASAIGFDGWRYYCQTFGYRDYMWKGFTPFNTTKLLDYIDSNFLYPNPLDKTRELKVYLA